MRMTTSSIVLSALLAATVAMPGSLRAQETPPDDGVAPPAVVDPAPDGTDGTMTGDGGEATGFEALSPGNQKIARAIFDAQPMNGGTETLADGETSFLTLDDIAALKQDGRGWGEIFHELQAEGLVDAKNLGQAVSSFHTSRHGVAVSADAGVIVTTGSGDSVVAGGKERGPSSASAASHAHDGTGKTDQGRHLGAVNSAAGKGGAGGSVTTAAGGGPGHGGAQVHVSNAGGGHGASVAVSAGGGVSDGLGGGHGRGHAFGRTK